MMIEGHFPLHLAATLKHSFLSKEPLRVKRRRSFIIELLKVYTSQNEGNDT